MAARVLIVEDDADLHLSLALRLQSGGYEVMSAMNGAEAVSIATAEIPDVILLDIGLPDRSGHKVALELSGQQDTRRIPIIYLTARHEASYRVEASQLGAAAYLVKPCRPDRLMLAIEAALESVAS